MTNGATLDEADDILRVSGGGVSEEIGPRIWEELCLDLLNGVLNPATATVGTLLSHMLFLPEPE